MPVRVGKIELVGLQNIRTEDVRNLVKLRGPGQSGGVYQDLGREPLSVVMEGILFGGDTLAALEELRQAQAKAKPMSFAADAVAGADMTQVLIADLNVRQLAGYEDRFSFFLRVREYTEPPEPAGKGAAKVNADAAQDAATWQKGALDAAAVEQDPGALMAKVDENPGLLAHLGGDKLGEIVGKGADKLDGNGFGKLLGVVGKANPSAVTGFVSSLKSQGMLGGFVEKLSNAGKRVLDFAKGVKLESLISIYKMIDGGADFFKKLIEVKNAAVALGPRIPAVDLQAAIEGRGASQSGMKELIQAITTLVDSLKALLATQTVEELLRVVKDVGLEDKALSAVDAIRPPLRTLEGWLPKLTRIAAMPGIFEPLALVLDDDIERTDMTRPGKRARLEESGMNELVPIAEGVHEGLLAFQKIQRFALGIIEGVLSEEAIKSLEESVSELGAKLDQYRNQLTAKPAPGQVQ